jgi:hypothetical protein
VQDAEALTIGLVTADADPSGIRLIRPASAELAFPDFAYRHTWENLNGYLDLTLNHPDIRWTSNVFVSLSELEEAVSSEDPTPRPMLGVASFSVLNVVPQNGGVTVRVLVDWNSPLLTQISYLVINL